MQTVLDSWHVKRGVTESGASADSERKVFAVRALLGATIAALAVLALAGRPPARAQAVGGVLLCEPPAGIGCVVWYGNYFHPAECDIEWPITGLVSGPFTCRAIFHTTPVTERSVYRNASCELIGGGHHDTAFLAYRSSKAVILAEPGGTTIHCPNAKAG